jgi:hypothetical protein
VAFADAVETCAQPLVAVERSTLNPDSLDELSSQERSIRFDENADAARAEGDAGTPESVVAEAVFEYAESPDAP